MFTNPYVKCTQFLFIAVPLGLTIRSFQLWYQFLSFGFWTLYVSSPMRFVHEHGLLCLSQYPLFHDQCSLCIAFFAESSLESYPYCDYRRCMYASTVPEMKSPDPEQRKATDSAISCGEVVVRSHQAGPCSHCSIASSRLSIVGTGPGPIVLSVTPLAHAASRASCKACALAALATLYE